MPKISVIMPVFNTKIEYLKEAIESILDQTFTDFEFIIINDGSTTTEIEDFILSYTDDRIIYIKQSNQGIAKTLNNGLKLAQGEYIARMDSDDISLPNRLREQITFLEAHPSISVVGSWYETFQNKKRIVKHKKNPCYLDMLKCCCIAHPTVMFKKYDFKQYNLNYNPEYLCEDYELWSRAIRNLKFEILQKVLLRYRVHKDNLSTPNKTFLNSIMKVQQNMLDFLTADKKMQKEILYMLDKPTFLQNVFSIKNEGENKVVRLLGLKFKINRFSNLNIERKPNVMNFDTTLELLVNSEKSLCRFGDGEFSIVLGNSIPFQIINPELQMRLKNILQSGNDEILIGIPDIFENLDNHNKKHKRFWEKYITNNSRIFSLFNYDYNYCDSLVSRWYLEYLNNYNYNDIFKQLKSIWDKKDIILVEGKFSRLGYNNDLFKNANSIKRILCPAQNAFEIYQTILEKCKTQSKNNLFILALGPTATVLAYDLNLLGYRALDLGHIDIEYEWFLKRAIKKIKIKDKYVNECKDGKISSEINDINFKKEILFDLSILQTKGCKQ